jgi:hypothetical protein
MHTGKHMNLQAGGRVLEPEHFSKLSHCRYSKKILRTAPATADDSNSSRVEFYTASTCKYLPSFRSPYIFHIRAETFRIRLLDHEDERTRMLANFVHFLSVEKTLYSRRLKAKNSLGQTEISHCSRLVTRDAEHT